MVRPNRPPLADGGRIVGAVLPPISSNGRLLALVRRDWKDMESGVGALQSNVEIAHHAAARLLRDLAYAICCDLTKRRVEMRGTIGVASFQENGGHSPNFFRNSTAGYFGLHFGHSRSRM